jgi:hypothetical protein
MNYTARCSILVIPFDRHDPSGPYQTIITANSFEYDGLTANGPKAE